MSPLRRIAAAVTAAFAAGSLLALPTPSSAAPRPAAVSADRRLFMVTDSVGLGALPAITSAFAGWQVTATGRPGLFTEQLVKWVSTAPAAAFGTSAVVATGYNYPYWDPPRFARSIDQMVAALKARGVKRIVWVTLREVSPTWFSGWYRLSSAYRTLYLAYPKANAQLRAALARHPELSIADWAAASNRAGLTYDAIHLNPTGAAAYAALVRDVVTTAGTRARAGSTTVVRVAGAAGVAADAQGVSVNLTAVNPRTNGVLTAYACDRPPPATSSLNFTAGADASNGAIVPIAADGTICVRTTADTNVRVQLTGAFDAGSGLVPVAGRVADTRLTALPPPGAVVRLRLGALPGAPPAPFTAAVNLTTISQTTSEVRLFTCGLPAPLAATRGVAAGRVENLAQVVTTDAAGDVCLVGTGRTHAVLDVSAMFDGSSDLHGIPTRRLLDTRILGAPVKAGVVQQVQVVGAVGVPATRSPSGASITVAIVRPGVSAGLSVFACGAAVQPPALTVVPNGVQVESLFVPIGTSGRVCVRPTATAHVVVLVSGWASAAYTPLAQVPLLDTAH